MKNKQNTGILFVNLGTPKNLSISSIRKYLKEFLMDPRVISIPLIFRWLLVYGIILIFRPFKVINKYKKIWNYENNQSPLLVYTEKFIEKLQKLLPEYNITFAMRYGKPTIKEKMDFFYKKGLRYIHIIPLYPQYATSTYGTVIAEVCKINQKYWDPFILYFEEIYNDDNQFIDLWIKKIKEVENYKEFYFIFTFHGVPEAHIKKSDPFQNICFTKGCCEKNFEFCYKSQTEYISKQIANKLDIKNYSIAYQSRLGKAKWLTPYLENFILEIINTYNKILLIPLSFVTDCLETLEELKITLMDTVKKEKNNLDIRVLPVFNDEEEWVYYWYKKINTFFKEKAFKEI